MTSEGDEEDTAARAIFRRLVGEADYPCLGARSVLHRGRATVHEYHRLGTKKSARRLLVDLVDFSQRVDLSDGFASLVAVFRDTTISRESDFEQLLWQQLRLVHALDTGPWDPAVSADPANPHFAFSAGGTAYFVVGLHPRASRPARRAQCPILVFNPHEQFELLRASGSYGRMRDIIRRRDRALHGSINPMMADHGEISEANQYSGRRVDETWRAPFEA